MLVSFSIIVTFPRPSGIRTFVGSTILRLIFSLGLEPTLRILGLANVRVHRLLDFNASVKRPFPSFFEPHYESEAKCKVFVMKISFHSYANKTNFHMKSFALSLAFIMRFTATRKWPNPAVPPPPSPSG